MSRHIKTIVYVDAFNLYYGVLRDFPKYKWLDIDAMIKALLPNNRISCIKYFTAPVLSDAMDPTRHHRQQTYLEALQAHIPYLKVYKGYFATKTRWGKNMNPPPEYVEIEMREEKGTDVNLAVQLVRDVFTEEFDCVVLISNDTDLAMALEVASLHGKKVTLITPVGYDSGTHTNTLLRKASHYHYNYLGHGLLETSQLPNIVTNKQTGRAFARPIEWQ